MSNRLTPSTRHVFVLCFLSRFNLCFARLKLPMSMNHWKKDWTRLKFGGLHRPFGGMRFLHNQWWLQETSKKSGLYMASLLLLDWPVWQIIITQKNSRLRKILHLFRCLMIQNCCRLVFALVFLATGKGNIHLTTTVFLGCENKRDRIQIGRAWCFLPLADWDDSLLKDCQIDFHKIGSVGSGSLQMYHLQCTGKSYQVWWLHGMMQCIRT